MADQGPEQTAQENRVSKEVPTSSRKPRISALVALSILEVIRVRDLPTEILGAEDPAQTMPRRLGLSGAVELQIRRYREEVRRRRRITDEEARDLFNLVVRRPDSEEVFFQVGEMLAGKDAPVRGLKRYLPARARYALARRQLRRHIRGIFGRDIGGFAHGRFTAEARSHFLLEMDPGGDACALFTGLAQTLLSRYLGKSVPVLHSSCQARKGEICRWTAPSQEA